MNQTVKVGLMVTAMIVLALLAGTAAVAARKGGRIHVRAGTTFSAAMLVMALTGSVMAAL